MKAHDRYPGLVFSLLLPGIRVQAQALETLPQFVDDSRRVIDEAG